MNKRGRASSCLPADVHDPRRYDDQPWSAAPAERSVRRHPPGAGGAVHRAVDGSRPRRDRTFASGPPGSPIDPAALEVLFRYRLGRRRPVLAAVGRLPPADRVAMGWPRYVAELTRGQNRFRWVEYSLSASLMIVLIAGITGITDVAALIALFGVNASMILFGWLMETTNHPAPRRLVALRLRLHRRRGAMDRHRRLPVRRRRRRAHGSSTASSSRSSCCSTASPSTSGCSTAHRAMGRLPVWRTGVRLAQSDCQEPARLANVRQRPHRVTGDA